VVHLSVRLVVSARQVSHAPGEGIVFQSMNKVWSNAVGSTVTEVTGWWLSGITGTGTRGKGSKNDPGLE
jgi:hypothetical protein